MLPRSRSATITLTSVTVPQPWSASTISARSLYLSYPPSLPCADATEPLRLHPHIRKMTRECIQMQVLVQPLDSPKQKPIETAAGKPPPHNCRLYIFFLGSDAPAGGGVDREGTDTDGGDVEAQTVEAERVL